MQLYYSPGSPYSRVARIIIHELGAACEMIEESDFPPEKVMAVNPAMQVPTLVDDDRTLFGTRLIADYLMSERGRWAGDEVRPIATTPLRPDHYWRDAQLLVALEALLDALVRRSYLVWTGVEHRHDSTLRLDLAERDFRRARRLFDYLEGKATPDGFIPGEFSLQDIWLVCIIGWTERRIRIPWRGRPGLEAIVDLHAFRDSVTATLPPPWLPGQTSVRAVDAPSDGPK